MLDNSPIKMMYNSRGVIKGLCPVLVDPGELRGMKTVQPDNQHTSQHWTPQSQQTHPSSAGVAA